MTRLERRYRLLLRVLPLWYRRDREDEMVATFLADREDELEREYGWPGWPEAWSIAGLGLRTRLSAITGTPRGPAVRLVALLGLLAQSVQGLASLVAALISPRSGDWSGAGRAYMTMLMLSAMASFLLLVLGRRTSAKIVAVVALLPGLVALERNLTVVGSPWPAIVANLPLWVAVCCLFAGFRRQAPTLKAVPWLWAFGIASDIALLWFAARMVAPAGSWTWVIMSDSTTVPSWTVIAGGLAYLVAGRWFNMSGAWATALAVCSAALLPAQAVLVESAVRLHADGILGWLPLVVTEIQLAVLAAAVLGTATLSVRALRRTPLPDSGSR